MKFATSAAIILSLGCLSAPPISAQTAADMVSDGSNPQIDYAAYRELVAEVEPLRAQRLLSMAGFRRVLDEQPEVLLLDARSAEAFAAGHMAGAVNLPLPDFTPEALATVIGPDQNRQVLIYCNNNFSDNFYPIARKVVSVSLNTQTFVNLVAYGYRNVWELGETLSIAQPQLGWISSLPLRATTQSTKPTPSAR